MYTARTPHPRHHAKLTLMLCCLLLHSRQHHRPIFIYHYATVSYPRPGRCRASTTIRDITPLTPQIYCHTFENKSSLPFAAPPVTGAAVLLVHPPNSSSAATLGCVTSPPDAPGTIAVLANEPMPLLLPPPPLLPHAPKSLDGCGLVTGLLAAGAGAGSAHALPPQTSAPENPPPLALLPPIVASGLVVVAGAGGDLGCVRLKTELDELETAGAAGAGAGAGAAAGAGDEKSKRSFMAEDAGAAGFGWEAAGEKLPKPSNPPNPLLDGAGLLAGAGAAAAGLESKKPPPLRPENAEDDGCDWCWGWGVDLLLDMGFRLEKAEFWGLLGLDMLEKLRLLNASFSPPPDGWLTCWVICGGAVGDARLPKEPE